ncbi:MAG: NAD(P)-dependent oxidoreductase [Planktomarina sp.]|nr:NAD(P)-dependent oxidoreductase [Planktomarina sp.]
MTTDRSALMPAGTMFVNTARGVLVDEAVLMVALDYFQVEPGGNPAFSRYDNFFMLPHIGSVTRQTRDARGFRALDNLDAFFVGKTPGDQL